MHPRILPVLTLGTLASLSSAQDSLSTRAAERLGLAECEVVHLEPTLGTGSEAVSVALEFGGLPDLVQLHPHSVRDASEFQVLAQGADGSWEAVDVGPPRTYRGTLVGQPGSVVAASLLDDGVHARLRLADGEDWWLQPLVSLVPDAPFDAHVLYASHSVLDDGHGCGADLLANNVPAPPISRGGGTHSPGSSVHIAQLGCDADFEYHNTHGGVAGATAAIETVINTMDPQYEFEVDITHVITAILVRTSSNQPYTSNEPGTLLNQFRSEWQQNQGSIQRDVAELFTGKNLAGSVIGIAWLDAVCSSFGYNVVQHLGALSSRTDLSAHELGHNWGAGHCSCSGWTMNPSLTSANRFHGSFTEPQITGYRDSVNCLGNASGTPIFEEGFESGGLTSGGWTKANNRPKVKPAAARSGVWGVNMKRTTWIEKSLSTMGFSQVTTVFTYRTKNFEAGEEIFAEWSTDGGNTWNLITSHRGAQWQNEEHVLPASAAGQPDLRIRFRTNAKGKHSQTDKRKKAHLDVIRIIGD